MEISKEQIEAIEFIKDLIAWDVRQDLCPNKEECENLETILNLIEKLQKENEELKNQEATARRINELLVQRYSNSIPVQKVKDNIEKLKAQYKTALEKNSTEAFILKCQITILQELIKESEE